MKRATFIEICTRAGYKLASVHHRYDGMCVNLEDAAFELLRLPNSCDKRKRAFKLADHLKIMKPTYCNSAYWLRSGSRWHEGDAKETYETRQTALLLFEQHVLTSKEYLKW